MYDSSRAPRGPTHTAVGRQTAPNRGTRLRQTGCQTRGANKAVSALVPGLCSIVPPLVPGNLRRQPQMAGCTARRRARLDAQRHCRGAKMTRTAHLHKCRLGCLGLALALAILFPICGQSAADWQDGLIKGSWQLAGENHLVCATESHFCSSVSDSGFCFFNCRHFDLHFFGVWDIL